LVVDKQLVAFASHATLAQTPEIFKNLFAEHSTQVPSVCIWYPIAQLAAVVLDAQVAAFAVQSEL
jgi:hypothetical protein